MTYSWPATTPRCKVCGTKDHRHYGRGLCGACYQWHERRATLDQFPLLPLHGNGGTDSWRDSPAHRVVYRNHQRRRAEARERQKRIWNTNGAFLTAQNCVPTTPRGAVAA